MWSQACLLNIILIISLFFMHAILAQNNTTFSPAPTMTDTTTSGFYTTIEPTTVPTSNPTTTTTTTTTSITTTEAPTYEPTYEPTYDPTDDPTSDPTHDPTSDPTYDPTYVPTYDPTKDPTSDPTIDPTKQPTEQPTEEPTYEPTLEPTIEPTINPITTSEPTQPPVTTTTKDEDEKWRLICRFILRILRIIKKVSTDAAEETTITDEEVTELLIATIEAQVGPDIDLDFDVVTLTKSNDTDNPNITVYTYDVEILTANEDDAILVQETIESEAFSASLESNLETAAGTDVTVEEAAVVEIVEPEEECKSTLYKPWTYCPGQIFPWILLGAAGCILLVLCVCLIRCCYLCCTRTRRGGRRKSKYEVGGALFAPIDSVNAEQESAFQSDLRTAIEMNKTGKLLKETQTSLDLDNDAVANAFDMDFDEIKPIKANGAGSKQQQIKKATSADSAVDDEEKKGQDDKGTKKDEKKGKKKGSEGAMPMTTGMTPGGPTPGGPTPGGPDDDDNPPPAPAPPAPKDMDDYDLL